MVENLEINCEMKCMCEQLISQHRRKSPSYLMQPHTAVNVTPFSVYIFFNSKKVVNETFQTIF